MSDREPLSGAEREFEAALGGLRPADPKLDRDALMFRAGQASMRRSCAVWRSASGVLTCVLATVLIWPQAEAPPTQQTATPQAYATAPEKAPTTTPDDASTPTDETPVASLTPPWPLSLLLGRANDEPNANAYSVLRDLVLEYGVDALPTPTRAAAASPARQDELLEGLGLDRTPRVRIIGL